jgi:hypothetical protein
MLETATELNNQVAENDVMLPILRKWGGHQIYS